jgi:very-short-patch-repair endonuclease
MGWGKYEDSPPPSLPSWGGQGRAAARVGKSAATTKRARELRRTLTRQEARLWFHLRPLRAEGFHFRRQAPFRGFYLDFVCFSCRLVVEVDGSHHADEVQFSHDTKRDAILRREGFRTLRFWNSDINTNLDGVMLMIQQTLGLAPIASSDVQWAASDIPTRTAPPSCPPQEGREGR